MPEDGTLGTVKQITHVTLWWINYWRHVMYCVFKRLFLPKQDLERLNSLHKDFYGVMNLTGNCTRGVCRWSSSTIL